MPVKHVLLHHTPYVWRTCRLGNTHMARVQFPDTGHTNTIGAHAKAIR